MADQFKEWEERMERGALGVNVTELERKRVKEARERVRDFVAGVDRAEEQERVMSNAYGAPATTRSRRDEDRLMALLVDDEDTKACRILVEILFETRRDSEACFDDLEGSVAALRRELSTIGGFLRALAVSHIDLDGRFEGFVRAEDAQKEPGDDLPEDTEGPSRDVPA